MGWKKLSRNEYFKRNMHPHCLLSIYSLCTETTGTANDVGKIVHKIVIVTVDNSDAHWVVFITVAAATVKVHSTGDLTLPSGGMSS